MPRGGAWHSAGAWALNKRRTGRGCARTSRQFRAASGGLLGNPTLKVAASTHPTDVMGTRRGFGGKIGSIEASFVFLVEYPHVSECKLGRPKQTLATSPHLEGAAPRRQASVAVSLGSPFRTGPSPGYQLKIIPINHLGCRGAATAVAAAAARAPGRALRLVTPAGAVIRHCQWHFVPRQAAAAACLACSSRWSLQASPTARPTPRVLGPCGKICLYRT